MFIISVVEDMLKIVPEQFERDFVDVLIEQIESKYNNRVIPDVGLCVSFYDFVSIGDPYVYPTEGSVHQQVKFRLIVFRPFPNEIIVGRVISCTSDGLLISLDFFDNIIIPSNLLQVHHGHVVVLYLFYMLFSNILYVVVIYVCR
jgi:DNA-directed RNA polymerase III subunit RPC8